MKVILSVDALASPMTGIGRYTWELGHALQSGEGISGLRYFSRTRFLPELPAPLGEDRPSTMSRGRMGRKVLRAGYRLLGPTVQRIVFERHREWLFHATNFYLPPFPGRKVVTIHDLSTIHFPHFHPADRVAHLAEAIPDALSRANRVISDSEYVRREIIERFSLDAEKVVAIPLACGPDYRPRHPEETAQTLTGFGLRHGSYSLFVGTIEPRKNVAAILDAYRALPKERRREFPLVVAGHSGWKNEELHEHLRKAENEGWLRRLGYVDMASLAILFAGARCFVYPSLYEGFGLPVLEAMASGVPVVTLADSSMEEVADEAGSYCRPNDRDGLIHAIETLLTNEDVHESKRTRGLERAARFSWSETARRTIDVYRACFSEA